MSKNDKHKTASDAVTYGFECEFFPCESGRKLNQAELIGLESDGFLGSLGEVGCDGCTATAEFRSIPSSSIEELSQNFYRALHSYWRDFLGKPEQAIIATGYDRPDAYGLHIHIGHKDPDKLRNDSIASALNSLAAPVLTLLEDPRDARLRRQSYGQIGCGDHRQKPYGLEWRVPSAVIGSTPELLKASLELTALVTEGFLSGNLNRVRSSYKELFSLNRDKFNYCYHGHLRNRFVDIWSACKELAGGSLENYPGMNLLKGLVLKDKHFVYEDLAFNWGLRQKMPKANSQTADTVIKSVPAKRKGPVSYLLPHFRFSGDAKLKEIVSAISRSELARREFEKMPYLYGLGRTRRYEDAFIVNFTPSTEARKALAKLGIEVFTYDEVSANEIPGVSSVGASDLIGIAYNLRARRKYRLIAQAVLVLVYDRNNLVENNRTFLCAV